jgi:transcriptional regulator of acetoin/glycerol metabolism
MEQYIARSAWESFHQSGTIQKVKSVRPAILASWQRSQEHGIAADKHEAPLISDYELQRHRKHSSTLLRAAQPAMADAREFLQLSDSMILLADPHGAILASEGDPRALDYGRGIKLEQGALWNEGDIGTNAIGTAIVTRAPIQIHAEEHFCGEIHSWTCAAAPIRHPQRNELFGVVDISGPASTRAPQNLAHAVSIAHQIESFLDVSIRAEHERALQILLGKWSQRASDAILIVDRYGTVIYASGQACGVLERLHPTLLLESRIPALANIELEQWRQYLHSELPTADFEPLYDGAEQLGGILILQDARHAKSSPPPASRPISLATGFQAILGESAAMRKAWSDAEQMIAAGLPILLEGETGVGKELFARAIYERRDPKGSFVPVNCGGLPRELIGSELFGYEKGAFTGADAAGRLGKVEAADGGLLCLDEIGEMPIELQPYLLRVLEDGIVYRLGGQKAHPVDLHLVSMTNRDLTGEIAAGRFRKDLFYRIATLRLRIPPLRERGDDVVLLAEHFASAMAHRLGRKTPNFTNQACDSLRAYEWPGNVRELRNTVDMSICMSKSDLIDAHDLPENIRYHSQPDNTQPAALTNLRSLRRTAIVAAVHASSGNMSKAAKHLGISRSTLYAHLAPSRPESCAPTEEHETVIASLTGTPISRRLKLISR